MRGNFGKHPSTFFSFSLSEARVRPKMSPDVTYVLRKVELEAEVPSCLLLCIAPRHKRDGGNNNNKNDNSKYSTQIFFYLHILPLAEKKSFPLCFIWLEKFLSETST